MVSEGGLTDDMQRKRQPGYLGAEPMRLFIRRLRRSSPVRRSGIWAA